MATLLGIRGPLTGARIALIDGENVIGRAPGSEIEISDNTVSRRHAVIRKHRLGWLLEDCSSSAGTFLNGTALEKATSLSPNDEVRIGHSIFLFDSDFDLQNADFTDNSVFFSAPHDETLAIEPVASIDERRPPADLPNTPGFHGLELISEIGQLFDSARVPFGDALRRTTERMGQMLRADTALLMLFDHGARELRASAAVATGNVLADRSILGKVFNEKRALLISDKPELVGHPAPGAPASPALRSVIAAPLLVDDDCLGVIYFERFELDAYTLKELQLVQSLGRLLAIFIESRQRNEALALRVNFQDSGRSMVIGGSTSFKRVLDMIRRVADSPATVLLIGETGTGKEVLAAEVHRLSPRGREGRPFVAVNCAAIPETLFESQLFGHEKGAFTGAHRTHQGYIEQAQGGTLFLDEIGEMSMALQPKLLRFLQEHNFTRVGGNRLLRAEVRIIAASNRDLTKEVHEGRFREDLFHRLHVMPIEVPPLRERREDIRALAEFFSQKFAKNLGRELVGISDEAIIQLEKYPWPGNVRELANCIERAVLLCDENVLLPRHFQLGAGREPNLISRAAIRLSGFSSVKEVAPSQSDDPNDLRPLADIEREHIQRVLRSVGNNQVRASEILGIHRNTLRKKLQEYGD